MSDRNQNHLYPAFRDKVKLVMEEWGMWCTKNAPGYRPLLTDGFRSTAEQQALYAQGRTKSGDIVTNTDGVKKRSNHQSALAADITLQKGGKATWDLPEGAWEYYGHLARKHGLTWGGGWTKLVDRPHIEWPTSDKETYAKARKWLKEQDLS